MMTLDQIRKRHAKEERDLVLDTLKATDWRVGAAAEALDVAPSSVHRLIERLGLIEIYRKHSPGAGRPRSQE